MGIRKWSAGRSCKTLDSRSDVAKGLRITTEGRPGGSVPPHRAWRLRGRGR
jgi:hypothetical protein